MAFIHLAVLIPASFLFKGRVESGVQKAKRLKRERADREALAHAKGLPTQMEGKELVSQITLVDTKEQKPKRLDFTALKEKEFLILFFIGLTVAMGYFNPYYYFPSKCCCRQISYSRFIHLVLTGFSNSLYASLCSEPWDKYFNCIASHWYLEWIERSRARHHGPGQ